jgi:hypothetical protein
MNKKITPTLQRILDEFEELKGQFVITESHEIERLIAIGDDDMDYYWVTYDGRKTKWNTCVGGLIRLKGKIDDKDYQKFIRIAKLNSWDQNKDDELRSWHKQQMMEVNGTDKFLTEICWDLN